MTTYREVYDSWKADPEAFWMQAAEAIDWTTKPTKALSGEAPFYKWFEDGQANTCWNCVDRHVDAGRGDQAAFIYDSPITGAKRTITYAELKDEVAKVAGALSRRGVTKGDRVVIYMPMIPEACISMLACARIGAVHSVVFGGFSPDAPAGRILDCESNCVITADEGIRGGRTIPLKGNTDEALAQCPGVETVVVVRRTGGDRAGGFPGADAILEQFDGGAPRARVGLRPEGRAPMREGVPLFAAADGGEPIGRITSGGFGPSVEGPVAMGYVGAEWKAPGTTVHGELRGKRLPLTVTRLPFVAPGFKR